MRAVLLLAMALVACGKTTPEPPVAPAPPAARTPSQIAEDDIVARRCEAGIAEKMPYLEPAGEYYDAQGGALRNGERSVLVDVRLKDSFLAKPVGVVLCEVNVTTREVRVTKVRQ